MISARVVHLPGSKPIDPMGLDLMLNTDFATGLLTTFDRLTVWQVASLSPKPSSGLPMSGCLSRKAIADDPNSVDRLK